MLRITGFNSPEAHCCQMFQFRGYSSAGRASCCHPEGHGFESRYPLHAFCFPRGAHPDLGSARRRHLPHMQETRGSIPRRSTHFQRLCWNRSPYILRMRSEMLRITGFDSPEIHSLPTSSLESLPLHPSDEV